MSEVDRIFANVELSGLAAQVSLNYASELGYAYMGTSHYDGLSYRLIGFTGERQKAISVGEGSIRSVTKLELLQDDERSIKMQARGVGTRMHNTPHSCIGTGEGNAISAFVFQVSLAKIVDRRRHIDGTNRGRFVQAAEQFGRILKAKAMGLERVVEDIHASFGPAEEVDAVLYNPSATMETEQRRAGIKQIPGIPPAFMVIRNPHIVMRKIGEYHPQ